MCTFLVYMFILAAGPSPYRFQEKRSNIREAFCLVIKALRLNLSGSKICLIFRSIFCI